MNLVWFGSTIVDEKQVNHWVESCNSIACIMLDVSVDLLFLISSNGVPRHWTTSINKGDTQ